MSDAFIYATDFQMHGSLAGAGVIGAPKIYNSQFYKVDAAASVELSTLIRLVSLKRANDIEAEIKPIYAAVTKRNEYLKELGEGLSLASNLQAEAQKKNDGKGDSVSGATPAINILKKYYAWDGKTEGVFNDDIWTLGECAQGVQLYKSKIDEFNNANSQDMNRMQSIVDMRDQAYSLASDMTSCFGDSSSAVIRNIGS